MFGLSDIGWVVGHSMILYGPQIRCARAVLFEGKPIIPNAGAIWNIVEKYKIKSMFNSPTAVRLLKKLDPTAEYLKKCDTTSLKTIILAGEKCDLGTVRWLHKYLPNTMLNDLIGQTETQLAFCANIFNLKKFKSIFPTKPGSVTKKFPGNDVEIFDE